ncbi:hypothetical protein MAL1_00081 [Bacteriophage DSS3_MAL1]|nr:hypothetical protein MAL1_00081 [Bacteriophage DSS3_MAL1]
MTVTGNDIVEYARTWIGAKWRHQGRGEAADRGIDCAGLLVRTAQHFDLPNEDMMGYRRDPSKDFVRQIRRFTDPSREVLHGAIGIFSDSVQPCHTGIFAVEDGRITVIHSEAAPRGRCHEQGYDDSIPSMKDRLVAIRLFKEVDYGI